MIDGLRCVETVQHITQEFVLYKFLYEINSRMYGIKV